MPSNKAPLYTRGLDRAKAERIVTMFLHSYQPTIDCSHDKTGFAKVIAGIRGKYRICKDCGMVVGVIK